MLRRVPKLAVFLGVAGTTHFVMPSFYDRIVPRWLPGKARSWTQASGAAELGCAALVAVPRTRRAGAGLATLLFVAVFPANVQMAIDYRDRSTRERAVAYVRLPLQIPLVIWARRVRASA
jgi:uncharacterized membrane protein